MTKYRFVPDYVAELVDGVCKDNDLTCLDIRKDGTFSGYFASVTDGSTTVEKFMGYDYALHLLPAERPAYLAGQLLEALGWQPAAVDAPVIEAAELNTPEPESPALQEAAAISQPDEAEESAVDAPSVKPPAPVGKSNRTGKKK